MYGYRALDEELVPYPERVEQRYQEWLTSRGGLPGRPAFTPQQCWWDSIRLWSTRSGKTSARLIASMLTDA